MAVSRTCLENIDVVVLAGGQGTRIRGVLGGTPKILAPIAGRAFLEILAARLKAFGMKRLVLGLGYLAGEVEAHLKSNPLGGVEAVIAVEPKPLGTAGALRFLRPYIKSDPVLVMNGDSFTGADLCDFVAAHQKSAAAASLLVAEVADARRYGRVEIDRAGRVVRFVEKGEAAGGAGPVNAGVYLFSAAMLDKIAAMPGGSLEKDVFEKLPRGSLNAAVSYAPFIDIGTPEDLARAEKVLAPFMPAARGAG